MRLLKLFIVSIILFQSGGCAHQIVSSCRAPKKPVKSEVKKMPLQLKPKTSILKNKLKMKIGFGLTNDGTLYLKSGLEYKGWITGYKHINQKFRNEEYYSEAIELSKVIMTKGKTRWSIGNRVGYEVHYDSNYFNERYLIWSPVIGVQTDKKDLTIEMTSELGKYFRTMNAPRTDLERITTRGYNINPLIMIGLNFNIGD